MKIGIVISTNEPEVVWNAFRFGVTALKSSHKVRIFLLNKGVEAEGIKHKKYNVKGQIGQFVENKGQILACGTCLNARKKGGSKVCPISTIDELLKIVEESDKLLVFG